MCTHSKIGIDWRDAAAYAPLLRADRSLVAWEFLRRDPAYRAAATKALSAGMPQGFPGVEPASFGLVVFEPPSLPVPFARPMWRADVHRMVVPVERGRAGRSEDQFDLDRLSSFARLETSPGHEHVLISDGLHCIRLDGSPGTFSAGAVKLRFTIEGMASAKIPLLVLRRLIGVTSSGSFSKRLHPPESRGRRWMLKLRAFDACCEGASLREIAAVLVRASAADPLWRQREPSIRSQAQRLARGGCRLAAGEYRRLLADAPVGKAAPDA